MSGPVLIDRDGPIAIVTLAKPETMNAFSDPDMLAGLHDAVDMLRTDRSIRAAIITGQGRAFCSGGNVKDMAAKREMFAGSALSIRNAYMDRILALTPKIWELEVPLIAAVNGDAVGAGLDLALMCDMRLVARSARFCASFARIGIAPGDGTAWLLARLTRPDHAARILFTGDLIEAEEAERLGLVTELCAPEALMDRAMARARAIAANPPNALRLTKKLMRAAAGPDFRAHLDFCAAVQGLLHDSADHAEAIQAFFDKRPGRYTGE